MDLVTKSFTKKIISSPNPQFSLIWLHGFGESIDSYQSIFESNGLLTKFNTRVILIQAHPIQTFDTHHFNSWIRVKKCGLEEWLTIPQSQVYYLQQFPSLFKNLDEVLYEEKQYWKKQGKLENNIIIGGFSQGCSVSLLYALQTTYQIRGVIGFCGFLLKSTSKVNLGKFPITIYYSENDPVVPADFLRQSFPKQEYVRLIAVDKFQENYPKLNEIYRFNEKLYINRLIQSLSEFQWK